ncbi:MAG: hypothetical protein ABI132_11335 [Rhodanobacteraceae bacterium]
MRKLILKIVGIFTSACSSECPTYGETCTAGVHGTGGHYCGQGHNWFKDRARASSGL